MDDDRKSERKRKRFAARLKISKGVICTDIQGQSIVLCNAGQATGLEKDSIHQLMKQYGLNMPSPKFIAEKGESYSFLIFTTVEDAALFYDTCNGKAKLEKKGVPLHMCFVENVPNLETICEISNPEGLTLLNNFISEEEEKLFITLFDWAEEASNLKNRQVKHYGYEFRYGSNDVDLNNPMMEKIPEQCDVLWKRLRENGFDLGVPDQLTINKYTPGQGIPTHVDRHSPFGSTILSLSLGSAVVMDWKHHSGKHVPVLVPARSMMIMQGEARYDWQHGIPPRTWDPIIETRATDNTSSVKVVTSETVPRGTRISLTFRWTRSGPCECEYKTLCDSVVRADEEIDEDAAKNLEELHVHQVYEQIACHFSRTRHKPWPKVVEFLAQVPSGSVVVDLGCGNGKNILRRNDIVQIAAERSGSLLEQCRHAARGAAGADRVRLDVRRAALADACADYVLCIAVIHHLSSKLRRLQSIATIARLLRPGGKALITVWAKDQSKSKYLLNTKAQYSNEVLSVAGVNLHVHENRTQFQHKDLLVPWKLTMVPQDKAVNNIDFTLLRYYHVFEENELQSLCEEVPDIEVEKTFYEEGNWCVILKKIQR